MNDVPFQFDEAFRKRLKEERTNLETALLNGSCRDMGEYHALAGKLYGLALAENVFDSLVERWENR
jgi:hypothetical protein